MRSYHRIDNTIKRFNGNEIFISVNPLLKNSDILNERFNQKNIFLISDHGGQYFLINRH